MSASPALPSTRPASIALSTSLAAVLFAAVGGLLAIFALAFVAAASVAPGELAAHPVGEALFRATPVLIVAAVIHLAVAAGLVTGVRQARPMAAVVALAGLALALVESGLILAGRDPIAAESADPARAAQSGLEIVAIVAAVYAVMLATTLRTKVR